MKKSSLIMAVVISFLWVLPALADLRQVHRASRIGGTGLLFQRIGDQLDPDEMNASIFHEYMTFDNIPLDPNRVGHEPFVDDPRGDDEIWVTLTYNYGINHIVELGVQIPMVFTSDLSEDGVGRVGVDARFLILNVDRVGTGIASTFWIDAPSFQDDNSSDDPNGGVELNFTLKGKSFTNYVGWKWLDERILEKMTMHATLGWGYEDYLKFDRLEQPIIIPGMYSIERDYESPSFVSTEVIYASGAVEFELYDRLYIGTEVLWRQYLDYHNDNNVMVVMPEISYTQNDQFTIQAALGFTSLGDFQEDEDGQPETLAMVSFTYHFPELVKRPAVRRATPPKPQDIFDIFMPSRKPIPTHTPTEEIPLR